MISSRLKIAAEFLKNYNCLADCGTDHAYLPIYGIAKGYIKKAIASDNKVSPLKNAEKNIIDSKLQNDISLVLAEGLSYLNPEIDVVSILGMGGRLISDILNDADLTNVKRLVLSPNSEAEILREFLQSSKWKIIDETFLKEKGKYYQIIICEKGAMKLSDNEKEFGPVIIAQKSDDFVEYITKIISKLQKASSKVSKESEFKKIISRIIELKEVIT